jgi:hypothetical protein
LTSKKKQNKLDTLRQLGAVLIYWSCDEALGSLLTAFACTAGLQRVEIG